MKYYSTLFLLCLATLSGCFNEDAGKQAKNANTADQQSRIQTSQNLERLSYTLPRSTASNDDLIYAKVGDQDITKSQIDKMLELRLFDLEWAAYELRVHALSSEIKKVSKTKQVKDGIEVLIEPPWPPPRIQLDIPTHQPSLGPKSASITMSIFCSYPSTHCAKMTPIYKELIALYPDQIKIAFFDFPQKFHFNAGNAAVAARCANDEGKFWRFHQGLYSRFDELKSDDVFIRMAQQVGIDKDRFKSCLDTSSHAKSVKENIHYAETLGFTKVPVTLINGLYINGPRSLDILRYYIDKELITPRESSAETLQQAKAINQDSNHKHDIPISELALRLEGITFDANGEESLAAIKDIDSDSSKNYQQDDEVLDNVFVVLIRESDVVIENNGTLERLILQNGKREDVELAEVSQSILNETLSEDRPHITRSSTDTKSNKPMTREHKYLVEPTEIPEDLEYTYRGVVEPKGETPLSRDWIKDQLVYRTDLANHFEPAELDVEGYKLMRLSGIEENDFYQTLGLQDKDVIMRVNEQWVHSSQNGLFDKLENEEEVSIIVMRKGLPVHIQYAIN